MWLELCIFPLILPNWLSPRATISYLCTNSDLNGAIKNRFVTSFYKRRPSPDLLGLQVGQMSSCICPVSIDLKNLNLRLLLGMGLRKGRSKLVSCGLINQPHCILPTRMYVLWQVQPTDTGFARRIWMAPSIGFTFTRFIILKLTFLDLCSLGWRRSCKYQNCKPYVVTQCFMLKHSESYDITIGACLMPWPGATR